MSAGCRDKLTMSTNQLVFQIIAAVAGLTGLVPLLIYLTQRRTQMKQADTLSDLNRAQAADLQIQRLQADADRYRVQYSELLERHNNVERDATNRLRLAHDENQRLAGRIAALESELDIARRQVSDTRSRYMGGI